MTINSYTDTIRRWATDYRRAGEIPDADGTGEVGMDSGDAGSRLAARFTLKVERDRVADIRYQVFGCGYSMAACAVAADLAIGVRLDELKAIDVGQLDAVLGGLPSERSYCADLAVEALHAAASSTRKARATVQASLPRQEEHGPRVTATDPIYATLLATPPPDRVADEDRHLFACLLAVAAHEPYDTSAALGLTDSDLAVILKTFFTGADLAILNAEAEPTQSRPPGRSDAVLSILLSHIPREAGSRDLHTSVLFAYILAARAGHDGHLWVAMGLFERPELTAAIRRHLPSLAKANNRNMRWKRYLYKQVCERDGGTLCKAPNCGTCSDYALCFAEA